MLLTPTTNNGTVLSMHTLRTKDIISYTLMVLSLAVCGLAANWSAVVWILVAGVTYFHLCRMQDQLAGLHLQVLELRKALHRERNQGGR